MHALCKNYANHAKIMQIMQVSKNYANYASPTLLMRTRRTQSNSSSAAANADGEQRRETQISAPQSQAGPEPRTIFDSYSAEKNL